LGEVAVHIVFDFGGVVFTWQPEIIIANAFADPAVQAKVRTGVFGHADWLELDRGTLPRQEAIVRAAARTGLAVSTMTALMQQVPNALVAIPEMVALLYRLKARGHTLFYLSNMHVASIEHLESLYTFWDVFVGGVVSCRIHFIKPEPEIYSHLLHTYALNGTDTVFIDDMDINLAAAAQFGIQTIKFENPAQCERQLHTLGCL
jgi:HAD superfamily hydrolase (TIGR01509 family)